VAFIGDSAWVTGGSTLIRDGDDTPMDRLPFVLLQRSCKVRVTYSVLCSPLTPTKNRILPAALSVADGQAGPAL